VSLFGSLSSFLAFGGPLLVTAAGFVVWISVYVVIKIRGIKPPSSQRQEPSGLES